MPWTKNDYPSSMKNLEEPVKEKAIEIGNELLDEGEYDEDRIIPIAISRAKEWYKKRGEKVADDVTHHLKPKDDQWVIEPVNAHEVIAFETKAEAMEKVKELSKDNRVKIMIHDSEGKFQKIY